MHKPCALRGRLILKDRIVDKGAVIVEDGIISYVGPADGVTLPDNQFSAATRFIAPGFVDIHNHLIAENHDDAEAMQKAGQYHLQNGTTACLFTLGEDVTMETAGKLLGLFPSLCELMPHLIGFHMEGPYINPAHSTGKVNPTPPYLDHYLELMETGHIKQWTFSPEMEGADMFLKALTDAGITPAIGHSSASLEEVATAVEKGAKIVTHIFNYTGASREAFHGTRALSFDAAAMLQDALFYEVICDAKGAHVPHGLIRLLLKTVGLERVVAVTDFRYMPKNNEDVAYTPEGQLSVSCMTMRNVAQNLRRMGLSMVDIFRLTALNPARAIGVDKALGSLTVGKKANLLFTDDDFNDISVMINGRFWTGDE